MKLTQLASERLVRDQLYSRDELKQLFSFHDATLDAGVFRPSGYNSVWLFTTAHTVIERHPATQLVDQDTLVWVGASSARTSQLVVSHELRGLELLVFYREETVPPSPEFRYLGRFEYQQHTAGSPSVFTLTRSGSQPSIALIQAAEDLSADFNIKSVREGRERVLANVVRRRGQASFRSALLAAYNGACVVTNCRVEPLLEAAHIIPYLGPTTNHVQNGLLLRADIHTLFDLQLLAIDPQSFKVVLAPELFSSDYAEFDGCPILLPLDATHRPSQDALRAHRIRCKF